MEEFYLETCGGEKSTEHALRIFILVSTWVSSDGFSEVEKKSNLDIILWKDSLQLFKSAYLLKLPVAIYSVSILHEHNIAEG